METLQKICDFMSGITPEKLQQIGGFMSGVSLFFVAIAAWVTFFYVQRRTLYGQWVESFRQIYAEFWKDPEISKVRRWITSDDEYTVLRDVLRERLKNEANTLSAQENEVIESLDKFLALILRVISFNKGKMNRDQRELWSALYENFWVRKIYSRPEIKEYVQKYWTYLYRSTEIK